MYGLRDDELQIIKNVFHSHNDIAEAILFGSRALGNYKKASDVDIAIVGCRSGEMINRKIILQLYDELNEQTMLPYFFDIIDYASIKSEELKDHINKHGKVIHVREV